MPPKKPELSVVIVMGDPGTRGGLEKTLYSLVHQQSIDKIEILVVDCAASGAPPLKGSDHPCVRTVKLPRSETTLSQARAEGVRHARAPIVGFLDEHSFAMAGWAEAILKAHQGPWAGVGGEIYNSTSAQGFSDPVYVMGHGRWAPPAPRGEAELLPSHDTCYKREIILQYGDRLAELLMAEPILMRRLRQDGYRLYVDPDVKSMHGYTVNPLTLVSFYAWSRCFAAARASVFGWSKGKRLLFGLSSPLIPVIRAIRLFLFLLGQRPIYLPTFLVGLPIILLAQTGAAVGEGLGMLFGLGRAEILFTQMHLRGLRLRPESP